MRRLFTTPRFEKRLNTFLTRHPKLSRETQAAMELIAKDPHASSLKTHRLKGVLSGCLASRLSYEFRIVFVLETQRIIFIDIGAHDDVYR